MSDTLHARFAALLVDEYPGLRFVADDLAHKLAAARDDEMADLRARIAELTAGQCTHALATCELHHREPVTGCPYPRCVAAAARTA